MEQENDDLIKAGEAFRAIADRLGVSIDPGATVRVTPEERDELMRALALYYEKLRQIMGADAALQRPRPRCVAEVRRPPGLKHLRRLGPRWRGSGLRTSPKLLLLAEGDFIAT